MILDSLSNARLYAALGPDVVAGFEYLVSFDPTTEPGRYPISGERVYAMVQRYDTGPATEKRFESHRLHLDIQYLAAGRERILHAPTGTLHVETPYREEEDIAFYGDPPASSSLLLLPGDFALLYPDDAHKPGCMAGGRDEVAKVVVKVRIQGA